MGMRRGQEARKRVVKRGQNMGTCGRGMCERGQNMGACGRGMCERGQSTVEFVVVTAAFLAVIVACGALWRSFDSGLFVEHALASASHHVQLTMPGGIADIFLY